MLAAVCIAVIESMYLYIDVTRKCKWDAGLHRWTGTRLHADTHREPDWWEGGRM